MADAFFGHHFLLFHKLFEVIFSSLVFLVFSKKVCKFPFFGNSFSCLFLFFVFMTMAFLMTGLALRKAWKSMRHQIWTERLWWRDIFPKRSAWHMTNLLLGHYPITQFHSIVSHYRLGMCLFTHVQYSPLWLVAKLYQGSATCLCFI